MPRIAWGDTGSLSENWSQVLGIIDLPAPDLGTYDLRHAINLVYRSYSGLRLKGRYAVTTVRAGAPGILSLLELEEDVAALRAVVPLVRQPSLRRWHFLIDDEATRRLLQVAIPADTRATGRRARKRKEAEEAGTHSLRWW